MRKRALELKFKFKFEHGWQLALTAVLLGLMLLGGGGCTQRAGQFTVVVSILPLQSFVTALAGGHAQVVLLVPPSATPHTFAPKPADVRALAHARLLVLVGLGLEHPWAEKLIASAGNRELQVVELSHGITPIGNPPNPHVWLAPREALIMVDNLKKALITADPGNRSAYERNAARFIRQLQTLDREYQETIAGFPDKRFIAARPAFVYLARDYGLQQVAVIAGTPGQEPAPGQLAQIIRVIKEEGIPALLALAQLPDKFIEPIVEETGIHVVRLDVLGVNHRDYIAMMRANLQALVAGFSGADNAK